MNPLPRQLPLTQTSPAPQRFPQPPQFMGSTSAFTQMPPRQLEMGPGHAMFPGEQAGEHAPLKQALPAQHCSPQAPQWFGSVDVCRHVPPQNCPPGQVSAMHTPARQGRPGAQMTPHDPQWLVSVARFTHTPPQRNIGCLLYTSDAADE